MLTYQIDLDISDSPPQVENMLLLWQDLGVGRGAIGAAAPQIARAIIRKPNEDDQDMVSMCRPLLSLTHSFHKQWVAWDVSDVAWHLLAPGIAAYLVGPVTHTQLMCHYVKCIYSLFSHTYTITWSILIMYILSTQAMASLVTAQQCCGMHCRAS